MRTQKMDFIVGLVITASIAILIFGIMYLKEYSFGKETRILTVSFVDIGTLTDGDPVKINGVKTGKVVKNTLKEGHVLVDMEIDGSVQIPDDSRVTIQNVGIMGERMIGIRMGSSKTMAEPGKPLQGYFDSGIAEAMGMLGDVFGDAQKLVKEIGVLMDETVANEEFIRTFKSITERLDRLTIAIDRMVVGNEAAVNTIVKDLKTTTGDVQSLMANNKSKIDGIVNDFSTTADKASKLTAQGEKIAERVDLLLAKINNDSSVVNKLLKDQQLYGMLKSTMQEADSLLKTINKTGKLKVKIGF
ncbi:MAG: MCE family protein [Fibrobacteres bacterium]|nr:MCE family protein [Fibrobacterota bacterium]